MLRSRNRPLPTYLLLLFVCVHLTGATSDDACGESGVQLQRIMSRCSCQVYYASYGGNVDPNIAAQIIHPDNKVIM